MPIAARRTAHLPFDPSPYVPIAELLAEQEQKWLFYYFAACVKAKALLEAARTGGDTSRKEDILFALGETEKWLVTNGYRTYLPVSVDLHPGFSFGDVIGRNLVAIRGDGEPAVVYARGFRRLVERTLLRRAH
jgi:hypothetical protein